MKFFPSLSKKFILTSIVALFFLNVQAEDGTTPNKKVRRITADVPDDDAPKIFIGVGTGLNNFTGIVGPSLEFSILNRASVFLGAGLGTWGFKYSAGARYYFSYPRRSAIGLSYSGATGASKVTTKLNTVDANGNTVDKNVEIKFKPVSVLNLTYLYFFRLGKRNRFNLEAGYSFNLSGKNNYQIISNDVITKTSSDVINFLQPGGIILAAGFTFGIK